MRDLGPPWQTTAEPTVQFLCSLWAKNGFWHFQVVEEKYFVTCANYVKFEFWSLSKVLLDLSHAHSFAYCNGCFHGTVAEYQLNNLYHPPQKKISILLTRWCIFLKLYSIISIFWIYFINKKMCRNVFSFLLYSIFLFVTYIYI